MSRRPVLAAAAAVALASWLACVQPEPRAPAMRVEQIELPVRHDVAVELHVAGGWKFPNQISTNEFELAVRESLERTRLFRELTSAARADYRLDVLLGDERTPVAGTTFSVDMHVLWSVSRIDTQETVWQQLVASEATATVGDAFNAQNRARVATERAARQNIERALLALAGAPL